MGGSALTVPWPGWKIGTGLVSGGKRGLYRGGGKGGVDCPRIPGRVDAETVACPYFEGGGVKDCPLLARYELQATSYERVVA